MHQMSAIRSILMVGFTVELVTLRADPVLDEIEPRESKIEPRESKIEPRTQEASTVC